MGNKVILYMGNRGMILHNVTKILYKPLANKNLITFESDIHTAEHTLVFEDIKEFETFPEDVKAQQFLINVEGWRINL